MNTLSFSARCFDGVTSGERRADVRVLPGGTMRIRLDNSGELEVLEDEYQWDLPVGKAPLRIRLKGGLLLEVDYSESVEEFIAQRGSPSVRRIRNAERSLRRAVALAAASAAVLVLVYFFGIPLATHLLQPLFPLAAKEAIGAHVLQIIDSTMFQRSELSDERQAALRKTLDSLAEQAGFPHQAALHLRRFEGAPNAFAVLPRHVLLTDSIVALLSEEELEAVVAHELGHLAHDHSTRSLIRGSIVSVLALLLFNGDPEIIHSLGLALLDASYSQDQEAEADLYAASLLRQLQKRPAALADALMKLERDAGAYEEKVSRYFSTHPLTSERIKAIHRFSGLTETR